MRLLALFARLTAAAEAVPEPTSGTASPPAVETQPADDASAAASTLAQQRHAKARKVEELAAEPASQLDVAEALHSAAETARAIVREELVARAPPAPAQPGPVKRAGGVAVAVVVTALVVVAVGAAAAWAYFRRKVKGT